MAQSPFPVLKVNPSALLEYARRHDADAQVNDRHSIDDIESRIFNGSIPSNERRILDAFLLAVGIIAWVYVFALPLFQNL